MALLKSKSWNSPLVLIILLLIVTGYNMYLPRLNVTIFTNIKPITNKTQSIETSTSMRKEKLWYPYNPWNLKECNWSHSTQPSKYNYTTYQLGPHPFNNITLIPLLWIPESFLTHKPDAFLYIIH